MTVDSLSVNARDRALFLDVDGTLIEIAESPDAVQVPSRLKDLLHGLAAQEGGALALISGREISRLDELFAPYRFPAAGLHGLERRDATGQYTRWTADAHAQLLEAARVRSRILELAGRHPGLLFEDKTFTLALHYRLAPELEDEVTAFMTALAEELGPAFQLQPGKRVLELKPAVGSKRTAIELFMHEPPFRDRLPVFVGDDLTDEAGFAAVNAMGGDSICVGPARPTAARWRLDNVQQVFDWLARSLGRESVS